MIAGVGFGAAIVGFTFPTLSTEIEHNCQLLATKLQRYEEK